MLVFAVISPAQSDALDASIRQSYPGNLYPLAPNVWLVADAANTAQDVCDKLGIGRDGIQDVIVVRFDSYFGFAQTSVWEWIRRRQGSGAATIKRGSKEAV